MTEPPFCWEYSVFRGSIL